MELETVSRFTPIRISHECHGISDSSKLFHEYLSEIVVQKHQVITQPGLLELWKNRCIRETTQQLSTNSWSSMDLLDQFL